MSKDNVSAKTPMIISGSALVLLGVVFLLNGFVPSLSVSRLWPLFMLIPVVFFISPLIENGKKASGVLIPGTILTFLTVYFLVMNYTGWQYATATWPVYLLAPALGLFVFYLFNKEQKGVLVPVGILTVLAVIFFGTTLNNNYATAVCFIALGVLVLVGSFRKKKTKGQ
jgi:hypothetical protein